MISVIIPHFNQPELLARCLASLAGQPAGGHEVELIVVDNGSDVLPTGVVSATRGASLLSEVQPGPGPARNTGIAHARGDILAFVDADMTAGEGWLAEIARLFADESLAIAGGDVRIALADSAYPTGIEAYESEFGYRMEHYIRDQGFTGTGNMAVRRAVIDDVGPFGGIAIAEDRDWGQRATAKGYVIRWSPGMIAFHPARASFAELARKWDRSTAHDFRLKARGLSGRLTWIARAVVVALSPLAHAFRVVRSDRIIGGTAARAKAFAVLVRIRLYRARLMLALALAGSTKDIEGRWRDTRGTGG